MFRRKKIRTANEDLPPTTGWWIPPQPRWWAEIDPTDPASLRSAGVMTADRIAEGEQARADLVDQVLQQRGKGSPWVSG
jgi:hypothetical protein